MVEAGHNDLYNEKALLQKVSEGDERAFTDLLRAVVPQLEAVVYKLVKQDDAAHEILQESFVRIWMHRTKLPNLEKPLPWLKRLVLNETFTWLNKHSHRAKIFSGLPDGSTAHEGNFNAGLDNLALRETQAILQQAITQLPPQQKLIYLLSREEGLKTQEIADRLKLSNGYVKNALTAALKTLKSKLRDAGKMMLLSFL